VPLDSNTAMMPTPDLHSHSTASDGTLSPTALVQRADAAGVEVLALTDHDTTDGIAEARRAAAAAGVVLIPGVEISVSWGGRTIHLVGLNVDPDHQALADGLATLRRFRDWRAQEIGRRLEKVGFDGAYDGAKALSNGRLISRTHFARFLVGCGAASDVRGVFQRYLVSGKPGHVAGEWTTLEDAVGWVRAAGGQAVLAHPARYGLTRTRMLRLLGELKDCGGHGLEVLSGSHSRDDCFTFARHARESGLRASAGSDYHGPESPWVELGRLPPMPSDCTPIWVDWDLPARIRALAA
jgi:predicted metal-dependent phosphoesterase TrpH